MRRYANWFKFGSWNVSCQRTGFKIKVEDSRREWNNLVVRKESYERRHPQDFLRGIPDNPAVSNARPRPAQVEVSNANLLVDYNGVTTVYWTLGADWGINASGGWEITATPAFNVSTDLVTSRDKDVPIGTEFPVRVGDTLTLSGTLALTTRTAGSIAGKLRFYQSDRSTVVQTSTIFTVSADQDTRSSGSVEVPTNAAFVQTLFDADSLQASVMEITNVKLETGSLTAFGESVSI